MLWVEDHVGGLRRDAGQEQPARAHPQHALHCLACRPTSARRSGIPIPTVGEGVMGQLPLEEQPKILYPLHLLLDPDLDL